jgi:hypothetical protein
MPQNMRTPGLNLLILVILGLFLMVSCIKDDHETGIAFLDIRVTDAPANFDQVNVEIIGIEVTGSGTGTVALGVTPGIYNLLDFTGGVDTLIASGGIPAGKMQQVRLLLGANNSIVVDGVTYPLATPSAMQSGLKLQVHRELVAGVSYSLLLDFDAAQSVVEQGNGQYSLKPVIRVVSEAINGSISGTINPAVGLVPVTASDGNSFYSSYTDSTGYFLVSGLPAGTYDVYLSPLPPLTADTLSGVAVVVGQNTDVGQINL